MTEEKLTPAVIISLVIVYIVWGSTYLGIKIVNQTMPAMLSAGLRFLIAGSLLLSWQLVKRKPIPTALQIRNSAITGLLLFLGGNGLVVLSLKRMDSGIVALVIALTPLIMVAMEMKFGSSKRPGMVAFAGMGLGLVGLVVLLNPANLSSSDGIYWQESLMVLVGITSWAGGSIFIRNADAPVSNGVSASIQMLSGGLAMLIAGLLLGEAEAVSFESFSGESILAAIYLVFIGSIVAFSAYNYLLKSTAPALTSTYAYVNPIVALILGAWIGGESITATSMIAGAIIIAGVVLITYDVNRQRKARLGSARLR